jgi:hypothetical protein
MWAQPFSAFFSLDRLKERAHRGVASTCARLPKAADDTSRFYEEAVPASKYEWKPTLPDDTSRFCDEALPASKCDRKPTPPDDTSRFYDETVRLCNYRGLDLVARDATAVFLDWDDTLFPTTWVQMKQSSCRRTGLPFFPRDLPRFKALCGDIISFLSRVSRIGHVFIVTAAAPGFIEKCCRICFPQLMRALDELKVTVIYARPQRDVAVNEPVEVWKEIAYGAVLQGRSVRPLVPELARFYGAPGYSHILSYGDAWTDHSALRSAAAVFSPGSVHKAVKARPGECALSA